MRRKWRIIVTKCLNKMDVCPVQFAQRPAVTLSVKTVRRRRNALYPGNLTPRRRIDADEAKERKRIHRRRHLEPDVIFYNNCRTAAGSCTRHRHRRHVEPAGEIDRHVRNARARLSSLRARRNNPSRGTVPSRRNFFFFFFFFGKGDEGTMEPRRSSTISFRRPRCLAGSIFDI